MEQQTNQPNQSNQSDYSENEKTGAARMPHPRLFGALALVLIPLIIVLSVYMQKTMYIEVYLNGNEECTVECGEDWTDPGAEAYMIQDKLVKFHRRLHLYTEGSADTSKVGDYTITYSAREDEKYGEAKRIVKVRDTRPPVITLDGGENVTAAVGSEWIDSYSAADTADGDLTEEVKVSGAVDTSKHGTYEITYTVSDSSGNTAEAVRTVVVV